jgi:hypothetical protein
VLDPDLISAAVNLTENHVERGELEKAYTEAEGLVKRRPESGLAHHSLAYVLHYAGLLKEAQHKCDRALALDPSNYEFRNCARPFFLDGNYERAMEYVALDKGSTYSNHNEVDILLRQGKKTETLERIRGLNDAFGLGLVEVCLKGQRPAEIELLSKDGKELFYLSAEGKMMAVSVRTSPNFESGTPLALFQAHLRQSISANDLVSYDVSADGLRFLINAKVDEPNAASLAVVLNWSSEMEK